MFEEMQDEDCIVEECDHDDEEISSARERSTGWHTYRCTKCGREYIVDSSG